VIEISSVVTAHVADTDDCAVNHIWYCQLLGRCSQAFQAFLFGSDCDRQ
jgi:hypothetical protein